MHPFTKKVFIAIFSMLAVSTQLFSQTTIEESKTLFRDAFNEYIEMLEGEKKH